MQILAAGMDGRYGERRPFARPVRQTGWPSTMVAIANAIATRGVVEKTARWAAHLYRRWVVGAELTSMGVPAEHAFGKDPHTCPKRLCTIYLPSIHVLERLLCA